MSLPAAQKALVIQAPGVAKLVYDQPIPFLADDCILVKTVAVGLNPTDWKHIDFHVKEAGPLVGCDYAGIVQAVGSAVTKPFKKGDRICGVAHGANVTRHQDGTFAEYIVVKGDLQIAIPSNLSFEEAATLGISVTTVGQSLYNALGLVLPSEPAQDRGFVLVYGGSTATGGLAIQYAALSGYTVLTTCSPRNNDLVKSFGADAVFDYRDPQCGAKIRAYTNNKLTVAFDTVSEPGSAEICAGALSSSPSATENLRYHCILPVTTGRDDVQVTTSLAYTAFGREFILGGKSFPADEANYQFCVKFWDLSRELLESGRIKAMPLQVGQGLEGIPDGLNALKENRVSGKKLVYVV